MKITAIETIPLRVPVHPRRAIQGALGSHNVSPFLLVKVRTSEGLTGLGEVSCTPRWSGEDAVTAAHMIREYFAPLWIGEDPSDIEHLTRKLRLGAAGHTFTKSALEMALWDLCGKVAGLPLYKLLGGKVRDVVPTKFSISGQAPERAAELAAWACEQGFQAMKVKVGIDPVEDVARVRAVREAVGPKVKLGVDANGGWNVRTALWALRRMAESGIAFAEQPVAPGDPSRMAEVRAGIAIPVIADESAASAQDALALASGGAADVISIYVGRGGIGPARSVAAVAEAAGLSCTIGSNLELGVAAAAMIHLAVSTHAVDADAIPCDILTPFFYEEDILVERLDIGAGYARAPEAPGLGVELDERKVARYGE